jgi:hypothetical protein
MVVALAIFSMLLMIVVGLEGQMLRIDRSTRIQLMVHPEDMAVIARVRRDTLDAQSYPEKVNTYVQSQYTLLLSVVGDEGYLEEIVWDFQTEGMARRLTYVNNVETAEWVARGVPKFRVSNFKMPDKFKMTGDMLAVRLLGYDKKGKLLVDQIVHPRREN